MLRSGGDTIMYDEISIFSEGYLEECEQKRQEELAKYGREQKRIQKRVDVLFDEMFPGTVSKR